MKKSIKERGITLLALVITIIILIILAAVTINVAVQSNIMEGARWASFVTEFRTVEEAEKLYELNNYVEENASNKSSIKVASLELEEKVKLAEESNVNGVYGVKSKTYSLTEIEETLKEQIQEKENLSELSSSNTELHEVDMEKIGVNVNKVYVINSKSGMLYRLEGEKYQGKIYHRPDLNPAESETEISTGLTVDKSEIKIIVGQKVKLEIKYNRENAVATSIQTSENTGIATIANGEITGIGEGETKIKIEKEGEEKEVTVIVQAELAEIYTIEDLNLFASKVNSGNNYSEKTVKLMKNLDFKSANSYESTTSEEYTKYYTNNENWTPIGDININTNYTYAGTFDGGNHTISNLKIDTTSCYQGLFGTVIGGTIENLTVEGSIKAGCSSAGIVNTIMNNASINNCVNRVRVTNADNSYLEVDTSGNYQTWIGGVCSYAAIGTTITNCKNEAEVEMVSTGAVLQAGGIVGFARSGNNIENCKNVSNIYVSKISHPTGEINIGGIAGNTVDTKIVKCYNKGNIYNADVSEGGSIQTYTRAGGIIGIITKYNYASEDAIIKECWNSGNIEGAFSGGISGICMDYTIENCYNTGSINCKFEYINPTTAAQPNAGGIIGCSANVIVWKCYNKGTIESNGCYYTTGAQIGCAGGIIGSEAGNANIQYCYNTGTINANAGDVTTYPRGVSAGGLIGLTTQLVENIINCYNTGNIVGNQNHTICGGIVGWNRCQNTYSIHNNMYTIGEVSGLCVGGLIGWWGDNCTSWSNFFWLENKGADLCLGNIANSTGGKSTSDEIKALITNETFSSDDWAVSSNINNGYPHLTIFDDTNVWLRNSNINGGEPYLKDNPPE